MDDDAQQPPEIEDLRRTHVRRSSALPAVVGALVLAVVGFGAYVFFARAAPEAVAPVPAAPLPIPVAPAEPKVAEVELPAAAPETGDQVLHEVVGQLSSAPELATWAGQKGFFQRLAAAVNLVASGENPRAVLGFLAPEKTFLVLEDGSGVHALPETYARYDHAVGVLTAIDPAKAAQAYARVAPFLRGAFKEIGRPGQRFDAQLRAAIDLLRETPVADAPPALVAKGVGFAYADPALESLKPAQKLLLRTGPKNAHALQQWLTAFERGL